MQIFINEESLNSQFSEQRAFFDSFKIFISAIKRIGELKNEREVFKSDYLFYYTGIQDKHLEGIIRSNPPLNAAFVANFQRLNPKSWQRNQVHENNSAYNYNSKDFVGTSVAELAERKNLDAQLLGLLLNFSDSQFGSNLKIDVVKNNITTISLDCAITSDSIEQWLVVNGLYYDETSGIPPEDHQTVLRDASKFEKTSYPKNNGRTVYRLRGTNQLWVVDSAHKHAGPKAHFEIFDEKTRKHLGTSLYKEINLNINFKESDREINLG